MAAAFNNLSHLLGGPDSPKKAADGGFRIYASSAASAHQPGSSDEEEDLSPKSSASPRKASLTSPQSPAGPSLYAQRVILTTYPGQVGVTPLPMVWGHPDPEKRGPIVASRNPSSIKKRNATGAHGGSYSVRDFALAMEYFER
jgi:hypothetical protein